MVGYDPSTVPPQGKKADREGTPLFLPTSLSRFPVRWPATMALLRTLRSKPSNYGTWKHVIDSAMCPFPQTPRSPYERAYLGTQTNGYRSRTAPLAESLFARIIQAADNHDRPVGNAQLPTTGNILSEKESTHPSHAPKQYSPARVDNATTLCDTSLPHSSRLGTHYCRHPCSSRTLPSYISAPYPQPSCLAVRQVDTRSWDTDVQVSHSINSGPTG